MSTREIQVSDPRLCVIFFSVLCLASAAQAQDQPRVAGSIAFPEGIARIEAKGKPDRRPVRGENVYERDSITTSGQAELHLTMADGASLIVRENSKVTLTEYVADGGDRDRSLVDLARGALRSITGWIGQYNRANYKVRTPLVTIGVRGTDHEPSHLLPGDARGEPGSYDKVNEGKTFMQGAEGVIEVPANRAVFRAQARGARPRLLATVPAFFRPGRHKQRFLARAQEVRRAVPQRRLERREFLRKRGPAGGAGPAREKLRDAERGGRVKPVARPPRDARASERQRRQQAGDRPQRAGGAKGPRPGEGRR